jgi:hypothetical protein
MVHLMEDTLKLIWWAVIGLVRSRVSLEVEILTLRHQLTVLRRKSPVWFLPASIELSSGLSQPSSRKSP